MLVVLFLFALLGDARIFLFVLNRVVFGSHREEKNPVWPLFALVPLLIVATIVVRVWLLVAA
ncbi:MAG TPA: hypothetical protein VKU62_08900, partial [Thermoanaerobaculia bacterium]|nr:hypothetical protein [Thermoanaerobaculia bacterium]